MIYKIAKFKLEECAPLRDGFLSESSLIKTASGKRISLPSDSPKSQSIQAEITKHPTALFFRAKAIVADLPNTNGDYFSEEEITGAYKSFEGVPFFTNHDNQNVENARGKIIFAEYVPEEKAVYTIAFIDREAFPHICRSIEEEYVTGVSMGCSVEYSVCNICENKAEKVDEYCPHIQNRKGRTFSGTARNVNTGEVKQFRNELVFEYNHGIKFIELSAVVDPAEPSCRIEGIFSNEEFVRKVANVQNHFYMIKDAAIEKEASKEDLEQLNGTLKTLEDIAVELVKNRQQIEVDFASNLVTILADLQSLVDELTAAGFGQLEPIPGVADEQGEFGDEMGDLDGDIGGGLEGEVPAGPEAGIPGVGAQPQPQMASNEISSPIPSGNAGVQSTGLSGKPARPNLPFIQPRAFDVTKLEKVASVLPSLVILRNNMYDQIGEDKMGRRRTISAKNEQKRETIEILSNSWQEKQDFFGYIKQVPSIQNNNIKLSVKKKDDSFIIIAENKDPELASSEQKVWTYEDLSDKEREFIKNNPHEAAVQLLESFSGSLNNKKGAGEMATREVKEAGADSVNKDPQVTTEVQLEEQRALYHPRTGEEAHVTQEVQLNPKRTGEPTVLTEAQLEDANLKLHPRTGDVPGVTQEVQLEEDRSGVSPRQRNEKHVTQEVQLKEEGYQTGTEPQVTTEVQLNDVDAPWSRAAKRDASLFKSASEHMDAVLDAVADSVIETGCTPSEACAVASDMVGTTQARNEFLGEVLDGVEEEKVDLKARLAFWSGKNLRVSSSGVSDIQQSLVGSLRRLASDETMNPDVIIHAIDILSSDDDGIESLTEKVDEKVESSKTETVAKVNVKAELRKALKKNKVTRESERKEWEASQDGGEPQAKYDEADTMIETTFEEAGLDKSAARDSGFRNSLVSFTKGALAGQQMRLASITNVTISGDTISIAVQTDDNPAESVEIPIGGNTLPEPEGQLPEGDMGGENLDLGVSEVSTPAPGAYASSGRKISREAQMFGGGDTAGVPGQDGEQGQASQAPGAPGVPGGEGIQSLTTDEDVQMDIPTVGEQQVPWAICPECGSNDVDVENKDGDISGNCKNCGSEYEAMITKEVEFKITKPTRSVGEEGSGGAPSEPEIPALPVAAQTRLDKNSLVRIASNKAKHGHVCPSCGNKHCEASVDEDGSVAFTCEACGTDVSKEILVSVNDPDNSVQRIAWDLRPRTDCEGCEEAAQKFASRIKWERIISAAAEKDFPEANCKELIAKKYGGNTTATSGPCKGKLLVECICSQLQTLGFTSARRLTRLAEASMQTDTMDTCVEKQMKEKGFNRKEAQLACNCLKKTYAAQGKDNIFVVAFEDDIASGVEKDLTMLDLGTINEVLMETEEEQADEFADRSFEEALNDIERSKKPDVTEAAAEPVVQATEVEIPLEVEATVEATTEVTAEAEATTEVTTEVVAETVEAQPENKELTVEEEKEMALAMQTHKLRRVGEEVVKVAGVPTKVESIEGNVEATVPRSEATIRTEAPATFAKPQVPTSKATMGNEEALTEGLPNVPVDSSYQGQEQKMQEGMPGINNEIKGTVIAEDGKVYTIVEAKQMKEVDSVEPNTTTPRADATMGEEEKFTAADPKVPTGNATMGNEEALTEKGPDVPIDNNYMGQEKKMQEGMPPMNDEMLKQVQMKKEVQLERIANARKMEAIKVASKLLATDRIPEVAYDDVVTTLAAVEIDRISIVAERMFPAIVRTASAQVVAEDRMVTAGTHSGPAIVMSTKTAPEEGEDLVSKLTQHFTIGSRDFDRKLVENDLK